MKSVILCFCFLPFLFFANTTRANEPKQAKLDLLLVVDNSLSMEAIHAEMKSNIKFFFQRLNAIKNLDWRLGLISTTSSDTPYLGLGFKEFFDYRTNDKVTLFNLAIDNLGLNGSYDEISFDNAIRALVNYPDFSRRGVDSSLAIIFVTDEVEQSVIFNPDTFLTTLKSIYGTYGKTKIYGAFGFKDMEHCPTNQNGPTYEGSKFQKVIEATGGFAISACSESFETGLNKIARDFQF